MIELILIPLMLAWILLGRVAIFLLTVRDQLILLPRGRPVHGHLRESGLTSLPTEVLYVIMKELECPSPETAQASDSQHPVLALSQ